jgi:putative membrane protein insertion efficiency factor
MSKLIIFIITIYQKLPRPHLCKFSPTCSSYGKTCFEKYGFFKAFGKTIYRIVRCNPFNKGGVDKP